MRHSKQKFRLGRFSSLRKATLVSLSRALVKYESIKTTKAKAKAVLATCDRLITYAKEGSIAKRRLAFSILKDETLVKKLFDAIAPRYKDIKGGYTRIIPLKFRRGDGAELVIFELTKKEIKEKVKKPKTHKHKEEEVKHTTGEETHDHPHSAPPVEEKHHKPKEEKEAKQKGFLKGIRGIFKKERDSL